MSATDRLVIQSRIATLSSLVGSPAIALGPAAGDLGRRLHARWESERRLLVRLLEDGRDADIRQTIESWTQRTEAFRSSASGSEATWTDRDGNVWDADEVLSLLSDTVALLNGDDRSPGENAPHG